MKTLQLKRCWAVYDGYHNYHVGRGRKQVDSSDSDSLMTFDEASALFEYQYSDKNITYPPLYTIALSLEAGGCVSVSLLNVFDKHGNVIAEGAMVWITTLDSYTEKCYPSVEGINARILLYGRIPDNPTTPSRVYLQDRGFVTITTYRMLVNPTWLVPDNCGRIQSADVLQTLLTKKEPHYVGIR